MTTEREYRRVLFMCAAHHQGGLSVAGAVVADILRVPFPIRMENLILKAAGEGFDTEDLWPFHRAAERHR